jgi:hypothetical protein
MILSIKNCGPIKEATIELGDLTILVGPQASGKSVALQLFKLAIEYRAIKKTLIDHGWDPTKGNEGFLSDYLGEGMESIWNEETSLTLDNKQIRYDLIKGASYKSATHSIYYIPAQRVMTFENGWPKRFSAYDSSMPYVMREFSENLFLYLDRTYSSNSSGKLFPHPKSLKAALKNALSDSVYHTATIEFDKAGTRKRLLLNPAGNVKLPMATWSAGQREFTPLLLSMNTLLPASAKEKNDSIDTVIIEEPEMGLHPRAIVSFMLLVMELLTRNYKVIISTHSITILETIWTLNLIKDADDSQARFCSLFGLGKQKVFMEMGGKAMEKTNKVHYFKLGPEGSRAIDISGLDPSEIPDESDWGGLTEHSAKIAEIVSSARSE